MKEIFQDTAFGFFCRTLSGGKILGWEDQQDPNTLTHYLSTVSTRSAHRRQSESEREPDESPTDDAEKGKEDYELIDWVPGDVKVIDHVVRYHREHH